MKQKVISSKSAILCFMIAGQDGIVSKEKDMIAAKTNFQAAGKDRS